MIRKILRMGDPRFLRVARPVGDIGGPAHPTSPATSPGSRRGAETFEDAGRFDLVTAGASIHWTVPALIFPKLARWSPILAILNNDPIFPLPAPPCAGLSRRSLFDVLYVRSCAQL